MMGADKDPRPGGPNQRRFNRVTATFAVLYSVVSPFEERLNFGERERGAIANDLSEGGVSFLTDYPVPVGTKIVMKFRLLSEASPNADEGSRKFEARGDVCHCVRTKEKSYRIGVSFAGLSRADRDFIVSFS